MIMEKKFHRLSTKNIGHGLSLWAIITPGKLKVNTSIIQFEACASGMSRAGTTYGRYGQTNGPNVNPYMIMTKI